MSTGYTYKVLTGEITSLEDFALCCAKAFGACITMRDDDGPVPDEFEIDDYHLDNLKEAKKQEQELLNLTDSEVKEKSIKYNEDEKEHEAKNNKRIRDENNTYLNMLDKVNDWIPPTRDHIQFKDFMINQLNISKNNITYTCEELTPKQWFNKELKNVKWSIDYHKEGHAAEIERVNKRNKWLQYLRMSL